MSTVVLFPPGQMVATPDALAAFQEAGEQVGTYLLRHLTGDWGDMSEGDKKLNDQAVTEGEQIMSVYHLRTAVKFYIITECDRSVTTALLPEEY